MKILILFALVAVASADVSHLLQKDGYQYPIPSKPFPDQPLVVDLPVQQTYLPPPKTIITPKPIVPIVPLRPVLPVLPVQPSPSTISFIPKPSIVQTQYLPPVEKVPIIRPVPVLKPLPTIAPVIISTPQPTIQRPAVVANPVVPVRDYLPPTPVIKQPVPRPIVQEPIVYKPSPVVQKPQPPVVVYQPTQAPIAPPKTSVQIIERPQLIYQPQPQLSQRFDDHIGSQSVTVEKSGYFYNNNPQPPFSF